MTWLSPADFAPPASFTVPESVPDAPLNAPVPAMTTSERDPEAGDAGLGWQDPGQAGYENVSASTSVPVASVIVRRSQVPPQPARKAMMSVALPNGVTRPKPQKPSGAAGQPDNALGAMGSLK